jgi:hypothetical protein
VPLHLRLGVRASLSHKGSPRRCVALRRSEAWNQILGIWTLGYAAANRVRFRMLCRGSAAATVDEGIEAVVQFVSLAYESIGSGLDRRWIVHYRGRAGVGSARETFYFRLSPGWGADRGQPAVRFSRRTEAQP